MTRGACEASDERQAERSGDSREARQADETPKALRRLEGRERVKFVMLSPTAEQMKTSERPPPGGGTRPSGITADIFRKADRTDSRVPRRAAQPAGTRKNSLRTCFFNDIRSCGTGDISAK